MGAAPGGLILAIGYIRVSMGREDMISPETQQAAVEDWARRRGRLITDWITDLDKTGRNFNRRIMEAITRVEEGGAREIAVWKYSRFGRNRVGVAMNLARLEKAGGQLQSATEEIDARTSTGKFTRGMLFEVAAFESDRIGETWRETYQHRIGEGLPPLGRARFGYRREGRVPHEHDPQRTRRVTPGAPESYVPDPELGPVLAEMYRAYAGGDGGPVIAQRLNNAGIPNTYGKRWSGRTVLDVLDAGFGAGFIRVHSRDCGCTEAARCVNRELLRGKHEPVITDDEWRQYQQRRKDSRNTVPRHRKPVYPVSGIMRCGHCDGALVVTGPPSANGTIYFRCSRQRHTGDCPGKPSVSLAALMDAIRAFLEPLAADIDARAKNTKARVNAAQSAKGNADTLTRELAAVDRALVRLAIQRAEDESGQMTAQMWDKAAAELKGKRDHLTQQLDVATREESELSSDPLPEIAGILEALDILPASALNRILRTVIRRIVVWQVAAARRNDLGHFTPQQTRIEVVPKWAPPQD